jgi:uncharacterized protein (TIGR02594 family)
MFIPAWIKLAHACVGLHEGAGAADNPAVVRLYAEAGHPEIKHDAVPWCAAFVAAMLHRAGVTNDVPDPQKLWAPSYARLGQHLDKPIFGCIGVKTRVGGGHVTFILGESGNYYLCLGGNQSDAVNIEALPKYQFTAFRWPAGQEIPAYEPLPSNIPAIEQDLGTPAPAKPSAPKPQPAAVAYDPRWLQDALNASGSPATLLKADGIVGPQTIAALRSFKRTHGMPDTPTVDHLTIEKLEAVLAPRKPAAQAA